MKMKIHPFLISSKSMAVGMQRFITSLWTASGLYRKVFGELRQYVPPELNANSSTTSPVQEEIEFTERWSCSPTNYWSSAPFPGMLKVISHTPRQKTWKTTHGWIQTQVSPTLIWGLVSVSSWTQLCCTGACTAIPRAWDPAEKLFHCLR